MSALYTALSEEASREELIAMVIERGEQISELERQNKSLRFLLQKIFNELPYQI